MPRFAPQSLPQHAMRTNNANAQQPPAQNIQTAVPREGSPDAQQQKRQNEHPAILLGRHIRRERGMQGVRAYVAQIREHLSANEYQALCGAMGVPENIQPEAAAFSSPQPAPQQPQESNPQQGANQMQMLQMLSQLMGSMNAGGGTNNMMGGSNPAGLNPALLSQLMGSMNASNNNGSNANGINPMMLMQLLNGLQK
ncbi:hypothetical protein LJC42_06635 [Eubacteriales bacterium OttesenSCG-928-K08]|nr:hypothetical protein [Eubacteriales bacterium OttesenSCG-928-K08]